MERNKIALWAIVGALAAMPVAAVAQDAGPNPALEQSDSGETVTAAGYDFPMNPAEAAEVCVLSRNQEIGGGGELTVFVAVNLPGPGNWIAGIPYEASAVGPLAQAQPGDCHGLNPEADNA